MELVCGPLSREQVLKQIPFLCSLFSAGTTLAVMYGVGAPLDVDQLWTEFEVPTDGVLEWIDERIRARVFLPGESDLFLRQSDRIQIQFCHESDVHVVTNDDAINSRCTSTWLEQGYRIFKRRQSNDWHVLTMSGKVYTETGG